MTHPWGRQGLRSGIGVLIIMLLIGGPHPVAFASERRHWAVDSRSLLVEDRTGDIGWQNAEREATDTWNTEGAAIRLQYTTTATFPGDCSYDSTTVSICRATLPSGVLGETEYWVDSANHIRGAYILVNANRVVDASGEQSIICHELGHALGLDHSPDQDTSCLTTSPHSFPTSPDERDVTILRQTYASAN